MKKLSMVLAVVAMMISTTTQAQLTKKPDNRRGTKPAVVEDDRTKLVLDNLLAPKVNPPIVPSVEVNLPLKSTFDAVMLPSFK